jgi:hypothetical protein
MHQFCSRDQDQEADTCTSGDRGFQRFQPDRTERSAMGELITSAARA